MNNSTCTDFYFLAADHGFVFFSQPSDLLYSLPSSTVFDLFSFCCARYRLHWKIVKSWSQISSICTSSCNFDTPDLIIRPHLSRRKEYGSYNPTKQLIIHEGFLFTNKTFSRRSHFCPVRVSLLHNGYFCV